MQGPNTNVLEDAVVSYIESVVDANNAPLFDTVSKGGLLSYAGKGNVCLVENSGGTVEALTHGGTMDRTTYFQIQIITPYADITNAITPTTAETYINNASDLLITLFQQHVTLNQALGCENSRVGEQLQILRYVIENEPYLVFRMKLEVMNTYVVIREN